EVEFVRQGIERSLGRVVPVERHFAVARYGQQRGVLRQLPEPRAYIIDLLQVLGIQHRVIKTIAYAQRNSEPLRLARMQLEVARTVNEEVVGRLRRDIVEVSGLDEIPDAEVLVTPHRSVKW